VCNIYIAVLDLNGQDELARVKAAV
jgi:hypothetical protein